MVANRAPEASRGDALGKYSAIAPMFTSLLTGLSNAVAAEERGDANALVLTVRWIGAAARR